MTRKNPEEYTQMQIKKSVLKKLKNLKIHPQQAYSEVIEKLLKEESKIKEEDLAIIIDTLYLTEKEGFVDWENKTHRLGFFKENIKSDVAKFLKNKIKNKRFNDNGGKTK